MSQTVRILGTHGVPANYGGFETAAENVARYLVVASLAGGRLLPGRGQGSDHRGQLERHRAGYDPGRGARAGSAPHSSTCASIRHAVRHRDICLTFGYNTAVFNTASTRPRHPQRHQHGRHRMVPGALGADAAGDPLRRTSGSRCFVGNHLIADHPEIAALPATRRRRRARSARSPTVPTAITEAPTAIPESYGLTPGQVPHADRPAHPGELDPRDRPGLLARRHAVTSWWSSGASTPSTDPYHREVIAAASDEVALRRWPSTSPSEVQLCASTARRTCTATPSAERIPRSSRPWVRATRWSPTTTPTTAGWLRMPRATSPTAADVSRELSSLLESPDQAAADAACRSAPARGGVHLGARRGAVRGPAAEGARRASSRQSAKVTATNGAVVIKIGVVGLGKMGLSHLSMLERPPRCLGGRRLRLNRLHACRCSGSTPGCETFSEYRTRCWTRQELDAVVISTPSRLHASMVRTALDRGLDVFCEKPLLSRRRRTPKRSTEARQASGPGDPGRLPQPLCRRLPGGEATARRSERSAR